MYQIPKMGRVRFNRQMTPDEEERLMEHVVEYFHFCQCEVAAELGIKPQPDGDWSEEDADAIFAEIERTQRRSSLLFDLSTPLPDNDNFMFLKDAQCIADFAHSNGDKILEQAGREPMENGEWSQEDRDWLWRECHKRFEAFLPRG
ncbi:hypothetical protein [Phyllobacterium sp. P5_D12]